MRLIHQINDMKHDDKYDHTSCWHITCHIIIMGVVISHKGGWFLQLTLMNKN
jgi:hypothetical protein